VDGKGVLAQESDCRDAVERSWHPHIAQLRKLQDCVNILKPKRRTFDGHSFNSADAESACIYPDLAS
jgi:hypothetical protein